MNVTIESPSKIYTEERVPVYKRTVDSSSSGDMLNVKRLFKPSTMAMLKLSLA